MAGLDEIVDALEVEAWPVALGLALELWRDCRAPELADLVDAIGDRIEPPTPTEPLHAWWLASAATYDPLVIEALLDRLHVEADGARPDPLSRFAQLPSHWHLAERLAAMVSWPADPRVTNVLVAWLETTPLRLRAFYGAPIDPAPVRAVYSMIADQLGTIADHRAMPALRVLIDEPPAPGRAMRTIQRDVATMAVAAIEERAPWPPSPRAREQLARCLAIVGQAPEVAASEPAGADVPHELWQQVARDPHDDAPRLVLADALIERSDPRGTLIALQLGDRHQHARGQMKTLIDKHWATWLGPLARLVLRRGSEFRRGMLETIRIGPGSTPPWVYDKARGHRELISVQTVRPHRVNPADYARFIAALPSVRAVAFDSVALVQAVRDAKVHDRIEVAEYSDRGNNVVEVFAAIAEILPDVAEIRFVMPVSEALVIWLPELYRMFPRLQTIVIECWPEDAATRLRLSAIAGVRPHQP